MKLSESYTLRVTIGFGFWWGSLDDAGFANAIFHKVSSRGAIGIENVVINRKIHNNFTHENYPIKFQPGFAEFLRWNAS